MTLYEYLLNIYKEIGFQVETTINVVRPGKTGAEEIAQMMTNYRNNPPKEIAGSKVILMKDFQLLEQKDLASGQTTAIDMPAKSNVLQFYTESGLKVSVRPSGTEPKIKFYCEIPEQMASSQEYAQATERAQKRVEAIKKSLGI